MQELSKKDKRFLLMAAGVATLSKCRMKHGCLIVKHGKILSSAVNITKNDPRYTDRWDCCSVHAEMAAMKKAKFPRRAIIYVARIGNGPEGIEPRMSKPCVNCESVLEEFQCRMVWTVNPTHLLKT